MTFCFLIIACLSWADKLSDCKCWNHYRPHKKNDVVECEHEYSLLTHICNQPEQPKCKCSGPVSVILINTEGTWCCDMMNKYWACENKEEWNEYYEKLNL
ncbi:hypothetical protein JTB14_014294 [Gonioctena quinquepunctata]|nr:hypothetical protein JTB14_014294 [Gonioctena quinquepunctata]